MIQSWFHPKVAVSLFTANQSGSNFEKLKIFKMEMVPLTDLFLNLWKWQNSHIQNLRSQIIVESIEWETIPKSIVIWKLQEHEVDQSYVKISLQTVALEQ
jgi:hypothetical protein